MTLANRVPSDVEYREQLRIRRFIIKFDLRRMTTDIPPGATIYPLTPEGRVAFARGCTVVDGAEAVTVVSYEQYFLIVRMDDGEEYLFWGAT